MTTRFSIAELADMLHVPVNHVRQAVDELAPTFTGESFLFNERIWRIAPSDVKRIQSWIEARQDTLSAQRPPRKVRMKRIQSGEETGE